MAVSRKFSSLCDRVSDRQSQADKRLERVLLPVPQAATAELTQYEVS